MRPRSRFTTWTQLNSFGNNFRQFGHQSHSYFKRNFQNFQFKSNSNNHNYNNQNTRATPFYFPSVIVCSVVSITQLLEPKTKTIYNEYFEPSYLPFTKQNNSQEMIAETMDCANHNNYGLLNPKGIPLHMTGLHRWRSSFNALEFHTNVLGARKPYFSFAIYQRQFKTDEIIEINEELIEKFNKNKDKMNDKVMEKYEKNMKEKKVSKKVSYKRSFDNYMLNYDTNQLNKSKTTNSNTKNDDGNNSNDDTREKTGKREKPAWIWQTLIDNDFPLHYQRAYRNEQARRYEERKILLESMTKAERAVYLKEESEKLRAREKAHTEYHENKYTTSWEDDKYIQTKLYNSYDGGIFKRGNVDGPPPEEATMSALDRIRNRIKGQRKEKQAAAGGGGVDEDDPTAVVMMDSMNDGIGGGLMGMKRKGNSDITSGTSGKNVNRNDPTVSYDEIDEDRLEKWRQQLMECKDEKNSLSIIHVRIAREWTRERMLDLFISV